MSDPAQARYEQLKQDAQEYDELHVFIAELGEKHIRESRTEFDDEARLVTYEDEVTIHRIPVEHITYWYPPTEF